tara:strand:+ start:941 stop:1237 length:297 start_codon:yes stop_codon:yes gene_type:complete
MYTAQGLIELGFEFEKDFTTYAVDGGDNELVWRSASPQPSVVDCESAHAQWAAKQYYRDRESEYPPIGDQLDDLFHRSLFSDEMTAKLQAVKDKHPKG